jgi:hypothetical protein
MVKLAKAPPSACAILKAANQAAIVGKLLSWSAGGGAVVRLRPGQLARIAAALAELPDVARTTPVSSKFWCANWAGIFYGDTKPAD